MNEVMLKSLALLVVSLTLIVVGDCALAQEYEFRQGYIFEQKYVVRIEQARAEELLRAKGAIESFRSGEWGAESIAEKNVTRNRDRLIFRFSGKPKLSLKDFTYKGTGDGDSQQFIYLRSLTNYHLVGVVFGHDEPGFLLIDKSGLGVYFVDTH